jgi:hypothetical protein
MLYHLCGRDVFGIYNGNIMLGNNSRLLSCWQHDCIPNQCNSWWHIGADGLRSGHVFSRGSRKLHGVYRSDIFWFWSVCVYSVSERLYSEYCFQQDGSIIMSDKLCCGKPCNDSERCVYSGNERECVYAGEYGKLWFYLSSSDIMLDELYDKRNDAGGPRRCCGL